MKRKQKLKTLGMTLLLGLAVILVACGGRDISTVDTAIEGHWTVTEARVNDEPLDEVIRNFDQFLDVEPEDVTGTDNDVAIDLYFEEGILTLENAEGDVTTLPYLITDTDEEKHELILEYHIIDEEVDITLNEILTFNTENRNSYTSDLTIVDVTMRETASEDEVSELEAGLNQMGEDIAREIMQTIRIELNAVYVDDADAPPVPTK